MARPVRPFTPPLPPAPDDDAANGIAAKNGSKAKKEEGRDIVEARAILVTLQGLDCRDLWQVLGPAGALDLLERTCDDLEVDETDVDGDLDVARVTGEKPKGASTAIVPVGHGNTDKQARAKGIEGLVLGASKGSGQGLHSASPASAAAPISAEPASSS